MSPNEAFDHLLKIMYQQYTSESIGNEANRLPCTTGCLAQELDGITAAWRETRYPLGKEEAAHLLKQLVADQSPEQQKLDNALDALGKALLQPQEIIDDHKKWFLTPPPRQRATEARS